jgi:hypothetical protein
MGVLTLGGAKSAMVDGFRRLTIARNDGRRRRMGEIGIEVIKAGSMMRGTFASQESRSLLTYPVALLGSVATQIT